MRGTSGACAVHTECSALVRVFQPSQFCRFVGRLSSAAAMNSRQLRWLSVTARSLFQPSSECICSRNYSQARPVYVIDGTAVSTPCYLIRNKSSVNFYVRQIWFIKDVIELSLLFQKWRRAPINFFASESIDAR